MRGQRQVEAGRAGQNAVVKIGVAFGSDHRVVTAVGAAGDVVALRFFAVMAMDQRLSHWPDRGGIGQILAWVASIAADHRKAARQRVGGEHAQVAKSRLDDAVVATLDLVEKTLVPGLRQPHLEADRVARAVDTGPLAELTLHQTVRRMAFVVGRHGAGLREAQAQQRRQRADSAGQLGAARARRGQGASRQPGQAG